MTEPGPEALRRVDGETMEAIYRAHLPDIIGLLRGGFTYEAGGARRHLQVPSAFDREEIVQETFAAFFRQCREGRFDAERPVRPYLRRIAINLALKRVGRAYREVLEAHPRHEGRPAAADDLEQAETSQLIRAFRDELPEEDQVLLDACAEHSQRTAGERLGLSRDQVYRRLVHIRTRALRFLKARGWIDEP